ncbi:MAG: BrnT family toxin, partial [Rhodoferax sp.]|nr:BrnT family toxin [Rhodoferax sp.]
TGLARFSVGINTGQVVLVWTPHGEARCIISMRKANDREKALYDRYLV